MSGIEYILAKDLVVSKILSIFVVPNRLNESVNHFNSKNNRNKAGFLCLSEYTFDSWFGDYKGARPLCIYTTNFSTRMPNQTKNCRTGNNSTCSATPYSAKAVSITFVSFNRELTELIKEYRAVGYTAYRTRFACNCNAGFYHKGAVVIDGDRVVATILVCRKCADVYLSPLRNYELKKIEA